MISNFTKSLGADLNNVNKKLELIDGLRSFDQFLDIMNNIDSIRGELEEETWERIMDQNIFVFGSNLAGRHGAGAAKYAREKHGAIYGQGEGLQGTSYAIPTKDENIKTLPLTEIEKHVNVFLMFAKEHPELNFVVTPIGCGLAGYKYHQIAPFFKDALAIKNIHLPDEFTK